MLRNSAERYGAVSMLLHWGMAALVLLTLAIGIRMEDIEPLTDKLKFYNLHKSLGVTVFACVLARIVWHLYSARPALDARMAAFEKLAARGAHILLYVFMVLMPISGWTMSSAAGRSVDVFGLFTLPDLVAPDKELAEFLGEAHGYAGYALLTLVCLHAAAALKHHFIDKDTTLRRMLPSCEKGVKG